MAHWLCAAQNTKLYVLNRQTPLVRCFQRKSGQASFLALRLDSTQGRMEAARTVKPKSGLKRSQHRATVTKVRKVAMVRLKAVTLHRTTLRTSGIQSTAK